MAPASPPIAIADLRRWLQRMEAHGRAEGAVLPFGVEAVDARLPGGGLVLGHLHEVMEGGPASEYAGLATLFTAGIAVRMSGPGSWCLRAAISSRLRSRASGFIPIGSSTAKPGMIATFFRPWKKDSVARASPAWWVKSRACL